MADSKTTYLENKILDHVLRSVAYTDPTNVYLALFTAAPGEGGGGTEATGGSYARKVMAFAAAASGSCSTNAEISFTGMPAGTFTHIGIFDALTNGNLLYYKALPTSITTEANDDIIFPSGNITVTEA